MENMMCDITQKIDIYSHSILFIPINLFNNWGPGVKL